VGALFEHHVVKNLNGVYAALRSLDGPLALFDFLSGELGHESLYVQALGGCFYDEWAERATVVGLCWKGCSILFQNTADVVVELDDADVSTMDSAAHRGEGRYNWLVDAGHVEAMGAVPGIKERFGPSFWQNGKKNSLQGCIPTNHYLERVGYRTDWHGATAFIADRLERTGFRFDAGERIIQEPYISLFDRNDKLKTFRNTQPWMFEWAADLAAEFGLRLAVLQGLYPRPAPPGALAFYSEHRDLRTLCNLTMNAVLHLSPPSGSTELAMIAGCDLLELGFVYKEHLPLGEQLLRRRGFAWLGVMEGPDDDKGAVDLVQSKTAPTR
jgi:hypothetical protein